MPHIAFNIVYSGVFRGAGHAAAQGGKFWGAADFEIRK